MAKTDSSSKSSLGSGHYQCNGARVFRAHFLIIFLPNSLDEIAVGHIPWATDQVRVLGRFDCNNLSDFDFVGFGGGQSSGQSRPTEWIVEQSRTAAPVAVFM